MTGNLATSSFVGWPPNLLVILFGLAAMRLWAASSSRNSLQAENDK